SVAQLPEYLLYVPVIVTTPLLPLLSRAFAAGRASEFSKLFDKLIVGIVLLAVPAVIVSFFFPGPLVVLLFGHKFAGAASFFPWIVVSVAFMWVSHAFAVATVAAGLQKHFIWIQSVCVVVFLGTCIAFIPRDGAWGATGARLAATFLAPVFTLIILSRHMGLR